MEDIGDKVKGLVKKADNKNSWKERFDAINEIKLIDCQQRADVLCRLAIHDRVWKVKHAAFLAAQALKLHYAGKPVYLGKRDTGYKAKDFTKTFARVKRESNMDEFNQELFLEKFAQIAPEMFNVMECELGGNFNNWISNTYKNLPKKKS